MHMEHNRTGSLFWEIFLNIYNNTEESHLITSHLAKRRVVLMFGDMMAERKKHGLSEWSCRHPAAGLCQSALCGGGSPGRAGRKRSSVLNFLTTPHRRTMGVAGPSGQRVAWNVSSMLCCLSELEKCVFVPVMGQQNDSVLLGQSQNRLLKWD